MKKKTQLIALSLILVLLLTACGASSGNMKAETEEGIFYEDTVAEEAMDYEMLADGGSFSTTSTAEPQEPSAETVTPEEAKKYAEKIIYSGHAYIETTEFDASIQALNKAVEQYNGFIQDSSVSGRSNGDKTAVIDRYAYYVVRIPTQHFDAFMSMTAEIGNVTSSGRNAENVTSKYTDYEARLTSLYTQEERLLSMLGTSGDLESLIALEQRLSEVRYEIESIERNLRDLDQRLAYSTVDIDLHEVEVYTETVPVKRSFGERLGTSFVDSWSNFFDNVQGFVVWLVGAIPTFLVLGAIALGIVFLVKGIRKKVRTKRAKRAAAAEKAKETKSE